MKSILLLVAVVATTATFPEDSIFSQVGCFGDDVYAPSQRPHIGIVGCGNSALALAHTIITTPGNRAHVKMFCDGYFRTPDPVTQANASAPPTETSTWWVGDGTSPLRTQGVAINNDELSQETNSLTANKGSYVPRPKIVGGCSLTNGQVTSSNGCEYYDQWGRLAGVPHLINCTTFRGAMSKLENWVGADPYNFHGTGGPITLTAKTPEPQTLAIRDAFITATGSVLNPDINGPSNIGFGNSVRNYREVDGTFYREDSWSTLKTALLASRFFELVTGVDVTGIIWDRQIPTKARGIYFSSQKQRKYYKQCFKDAVIVAGGAKASIEFLMLNGIGPAADLAQHGIASVVDLPGVGKNFMNQLQFIMVFAKPGVPDPRIQGAGIMGLYRSSRAIARNDTLPDIMNALTRVASSPTSTVYVLVTQLNRYDVRGSVKLTSPLYGVKSNFNFDFFKGVEGAADADIALEVFKRNRAALALAGAVEVTPGAAVPSTATDAQIKTWLYANSLGNWHIHGGNQMGQESDPNTVVNGHFEVVGTENLYVCDNSVNPVQHPGHASAHTALATGTLCAKVLMSDHPSWK